MTESTSIPITFLVPSSSGEPIEIEMPHQALKMVVAARDAIGLLDESWNARGVYFLFGRGEGDKDYSVYVGKAPSGLKKRIQHHVRTRKDDWSRALLIASDTTHGFDSAAVGWLEGRLWTLMQAATAAQVTNSNRPSDLSLPPYHRKALEHYVEPVAAVLRAIGYSPDTPDQQPGTSGLERRTPRRPAQHSETMTDLIEGGFLDAGTHVRSIPAKYDAVALVLDDGALKVDGKRYQTPSAAAGAVRDGSVNGWDFWGVLSGGGQLVSLATLRERLQREGPRERRGPAKTVHVSEESSDEPPEEVEKSEEAHQEPRQAATTHSIGIADLVRAGELNVGEIVRRTYKGQTVEATITATGIDPGDGESLSPSAAAGKAAGLKAVNGWEFWRVTRNGKEVALTSVRSAAEARRLGNEGSAGL